MSTGTHADAIALLFTDIEGSTELWEREPALMPLALARHDALVRTAVESHRGTVVKMLGDGAHAVFDEPARAVDAVLELQQALSAPGSTGSLRLNVRSGLHWGIVERRDDDFFGIEVNRAARIAGVAYGGQVLLSEAVAKRIAERLPEGAGLLDLGEVRLKGMAAPERVYQVLHPRLPRDFPPLRSLEATPNNLPQPSTSFIGRAAEIGEARELFERSRLLTFIGFGGVGKTRLALEVGSALLDTFRDGVWIVDLTQIRDASLFTSEIVKTLSIRADPGRPHMDAICAHLRTRNLLLILDNCEHLLGACAELAQAIIRTARDVRILATSREPLNVHGEQRYSLQPLPVPGTAAGTAALIDSPAVRLFVERAQLCHPGFSLDDRNASAIAELVTRLDGIPLSIELAAARTRSLTIRELTKRIEDRFRLLASGSRTGSTRQQSLRAVIDWSYDQLSQQERQCLCQVSVFSGGWTLSAAEAMCGGEGTHERLASLLDMSLIGADERDGAMRYRMLETVREYALERLRELGGEADARRRHLAYFRDLGEEAEPHLRDSQQRTWLKRVEAEHDNINTALARSLRDGDVESGLRLASAVSWSWYVSGYVEEGLATIRALLDSATDLPPAIRAKALGRAGILARDPTVSRTYDEQSLALFRELGDKGGIAGALNNLGTWAMRRADRATARSMFQESLAIFRSLDNRAASAVALTNLANLAAREHDVPAARAWLEQCLTIWRELRHDWGTANCLFELGRIAYDDHDYVAAESLYEQSLAIRRVLGHKVGIANALRALGDIACARHDYAAARSLCEESLAISRRLDDPGCIFDSLAGLAAIAAGEARADRAARILGAIERLSEEQHLADYVDENEPSEQAAQASAARVALGDAAFEAAWREGRAMTQERAIQYALARQ